MPIPFMTLGPGEDRADIEAAIRRVIDRGWFVLGPEVEAFESEFATASGAAHAVGVNTGTDALMLALRALDIGPGDEVITTPLTAGYTALAIRMAGATPVFADVDPVRCAVAPAAVEAAITSRTRAMVPVHLYGQPADMAAIMAIAQRHRLAVTVHSTDRDALQAALAADGVGTLVHYPIPLHRQPAFADLRAADCPVADTMASSVLSLPLHPALAEADVDAVAASVGKFQPAPERATASR